MKPITVLITSSGSNLTHLLVKSLKNNYEKRKVRIICTDKLDQIFIRNFSDRFYLTPHGKSQNYISSLLRICKKEGVNVIFPRSGSEILTISKNIDKFLRLKIVPALSEFDSIKNTLNKYETYTLLEKHGIAVPKNYLVKNKKEFVSSLKKLDYPKNPICFKPSNYSKTGGGKGFRILRKKNTVYSRIFNEPSNSKEIDFSTALKIFEAGKKHNLLVSEFLPGDEYSVYVLAKNGKMKYYVSSLVIRPTNENVSKSMIVDNLKLKKISEKIIKIMNFDYIINLQFRLSNKKEIKLLEVNPRTATGITLPIKAGINFPYLAVKQALGEKLPNHKIKTKLGQIRFWDEFYISNQIKI